MYKCMSDTNTSCTNVCQIQILHVQMYVRYKYFEKYFSNTFQISSLIQNSVNSCFL